MGARIYFRGDATPSDPGELAFALSPFVDDGWTMKVQLADDSSKDQGWLVDMDKPGGHVSFRIREGASIAEWVETVQREVSSSS